MSYWTVNKQVSLINAADPSQAVQTALTGAGGTQLGQGDLVQTADPPVTLAGFTQVQTTGGASGWVPTASLNQGIVGSTALNVGVGVIALGALYWFFIRK
jgi:hypothetical protein